MESNSYVVNLEEMSYAEMRKLAKLLGIRANQKKQKLLQNLRQSTQLHKKEVMELMSDMVENDSENRAEEKIPAKAKRHIRRRTFDKDEAEMGHLTPTITLKENDETNPKKFPRHMASETKSEVDSVPDNRRPLRILKKEAFDRSKIPRPARVKQDEAITTKTKDFAKIHKKMFDQMESVDDYVKNKRVRGELLQKGFTPSPTKRIRGELLQKGFTPSTKKKPLHNGPWMPSVMSIKDASFNFGKNLKANLFSLSSQKKQNISKIINIKPKVRDSKTRQQLFKKTTISSNREQVITKQREFVKGVRSNRRFDLQMKMRLGRQPCD